MDNKQAVTYCNGQEAALPLKNNQSWQNWNWNQKLGPKTVMDGREDGSDDDRKSPEMMRRPWSKEVLA
jgi:hypothetical protein